MNPSPNATKLKAFADDKLNLANMMIFLFDRAENNEWEKKKNVCYQQFLLFPQCFLKQSKGSLKVMIVW